LPRVYLSPNGEQWRAAEWLPPKTLDAQSRSAYIFLVGPILDFFINFLTIGLIGMLMAVSPRA
jgi:hypothetical protein